MSITPSPDLRFRIMLQSDLPAVLAVEKRSFRQPWDREQFLGAVGGKSGARAFVLESSGRPIAYYVLEFEGRNIHLLNLAVHPQHRRRGHGSRILAEIERRCLEAIESGAAAARRGTLPDPGRDEDEASTPLAEIYLEVQETNLPAQLLYKKMGYRATKVLRNHYRALGEDGYRMVRKVYAAPLGSASA